MLEVASKQGASIAERNEIINQAFPEAVHRAGWRLLIRENATEFSIAEHAIVIGIAVWSNLDLQGLDTLRERWSGQVPIFVFSLDEFGASDGIKVFIPGVPLPMRTPVMVEYRNGEAIKSAEGATALAWMKQI